MGWIINSERYLNEDEQQNNGLEFYNYFINRGWTLNAIAGTLGNIVVESKINPGQWQGFRVGDMDAGYGLTQWTPASKYINWAGVDYNTGERQCERLVYEVTATGENGQFFPTEKYPIRFPQYIKSLETPEYLADCFLLNYERPNEYHPELRMTYAREWFDFLGGVTPITNKRKMPIYFMIRRR